MRIIPAIDIINGKCVRLTQGNYDTMKIYNEDPLSVALSFEESGMKYLHLVDLDGARSKHIVNYKILKEIASKTALSVDFGGGLKSQKDIEIAFENGASQLTIGSVAVNDPSLFLEWVDLYGEDKIILGADCIDRKIAQQGWTKKSEWDIIDFISAYEKKGILYVTCTDISKDGMLNGSSVELYSEIIAKTKIKLIASGGVSSVNDLDNLRSIGCEGVIIGKALYEGKIKIKELKNYAEEKNNSLP
jgi:phosphoribosylformimino-5-aminoimidazole carboxamide ribotide isomerase